MLQGTGIILSNKHVFRDGAVKIKFRFTGKKIDKSDYIAFGSRMTEDLTVNILMIFRSGKIETRVLEKGKIKFIVTGETKQVGDGFHLLEGYFFDNMLSGSLDGASLESAEHPWFTLQEGFLGVLTNANIEIKESFYSDVHLPQGNSYFGVNFNYANKDSSFVVNQNGSFNFHSKENFAKKSSAPSFIPFFHKRESHSMKIFLEAWLLKFLQQPRKS